MIDLLIVDDHQIFIDGLKALLEGHPGIRHIYHALKGQDAIDICKKNNVDIVLMDISMPGMNGIEATEKILKIKPKTKVLMLTMYNEMKYIDRVVQTNAMGYILKNTGRHELFEAIQRVNQGKKYFSEAVTDNMVDSIKYKGSGTKISGEIKLTKREQQVLKLIAKELTTLEISQQLHISQHTAETHRRNLISKLGVKNSIGLVRYAYERGMIED